MIKYDYEITVNGNQAKLNKDIYLFRGNKNVHYYFAVKNASFNFKGSTDLIEKTNAINAAVTVIKPNNVEVASAIAKVENGKIHLKVTEDLIDEEVEVGDFDLVFDLFDDTDGAVTIPKVIGQFHVLERPCTTPISELVATNTTNEVDQALTDYAIVTYAEPVASTNADGTFAKKTWVAKEKITTAELNRMEEGISDVSSQCKDIANLSLTKHTDGKVYIKKQDGTLIGTGIEFPTDVDLSKVTMSMSGQTLKLMNNGTQVATVEIPTAVVTDEQLTTILQSKIDDGTLSALSIEDNSIGEEKLNFPIIKARKSTNLFNKDTATLHCRILQNGGIQSFTEGTAYYESWFTSDFIDITGNNGYIIANGWHSYCLYDGNKTFLSGYCPTIDLNSNNVIEIEATVKYIKISGWLSNIDLFKVNLGNMLFKYENYNDTFIPNNSVSNDCLSEKIIIDNIDTSDLVLINRTNNLIDFSTIKIDYNIDKTTGEEISVSSGYYYAITDFIKVKNNMSYNINCGCVYYYDKDKKYLNNSGEISNIKNITTSADCEFVRLRIGSPSNGANIKLPYYIIEGEKPFTVEQRDEYIDENLIKDNVLYKSVLYRMRKLFNPTIKTTISLLGDSNTAGLETGATGVYLKNCWANLLKNHIETHFGVDVYLPVYSKYISAIGSYYEGTCWFNRDTGFVNLKFYGAICKIHYIGCSSSIMTVTVDDATPIEVDTSTTGIYEINNLTEEYHTLKISTKDTNKIRISGITVHKYVTVSNDGITGATTSSLPSTFTKDIAIITYGTNSRVSTSLSTMKMEFEDFIKKQNDKNIDVILMSPTPATDGFETGTTTGFKMSDIDSVIAQVCADFNMEHISLYQYILDYCDFTGTDLNSMLKDTLHITENTHYIIFKYLCNKLGLGRDISKYLPTN